MGTSDPNREIPESISLATPHKLLAKLVISQGEAETGQLYVPWYSNRLLWLQIEIYTAWAVRRKLLVHSAVVNDHVQYNNHANDRVEQQEIGPFGNENKTKQSWQKKARLSW